MDLQEKIALLNLMYKVADEYLPEGYKDKIKQTHIEDDKWHSVLEIKMFDVGPNEEWWENLESTYEVTCCKWSDDFEKPNIDYGYIHIYERQENGYNKDVFAVSVEDAKEYYTV